MKILNLLAGAASDIRKTARSAKGSPARGADARSVTGRVNHKAPLPRRTSSFTASGSSGAGWRLFRFCSVLNSPGAYCAITPGVFPARNSLAFFCMQAAGVPYDHFAHEDGGQIAVCDIIGVDGAVDRPVTCETQSYCLNSDGAALCKDKFFFGEGFAISTEFLI